MQHPTRWTLVAVVFELSLAVLAVAVGYALDHSPLTLLPLDTTSLDLVALQFLLGCFAALPLLAGLLWSEGCRWQPLVRLHQLVLHHLVPIFRGCTRWQLLAASAAAGWGEELLFRGLLQQGLADWIGHPWGPLAGITVASIVFGLAHAITPAYAVVAALVGLYLGLLLWATSTLWAPIVTHAAYDYLALRYLLRKS